MDELVHAREGLFPDNPTVSERLVERLRARVVAQVGGVHGSEQSHVVA